MSDPNWFQKKWGVIQNPDIDSLYEKLIELDVRVRILEQENVELTNCLYEVENRLQSQIDKIHPVTYNLNNYSLDK
jgi:hypothetical protein